MHEIGKAYRFILTSNAFQLVPETQPIENLVRLANTLACTRVVNLWYNTNAILKGLEPVKDEENYRSIYRIIQEIHAFNKVYKRASIL